MPNLSYLKSIGLKIIAILTFICALGAPGCTSSPKEPPKFAFDPKQVTQLEIAKFEPDSDQHWVVVLSQKGKPGKPAWEITSAPADLPLMDRVANSNYVQHLLDTLQTLKLSPNPERGPPEAFGLTPPRIAVKWRSQDTTFALNLGVWTRDGDGKPSARAASVGMNKDSSAQEVFLASGAALGMLEEIRNFEALRNRVWVLVHPDDIDEMELFHKGKPQLYAQREGSVWTDSRHKPIQTRDPGKILEQLVTTELKAFVDDERQVNQIKKQNSIFEARLTHRLGGVSTLQIFTYDGKTYGKNSSRTGIFELPAEMIRLWAPPSARKTPNDS